VRKCWAPGLFGAARRVRIVELRHRAPLDRSHERMSDTRRNARDDLRARRSPGAAGVDCAGSNGSRRSSIGWSSTTDSKCIT